MPKSQEQQPRPVEQKSEEPSTNKVNKLEKEAEIDLLDYMTYISCEDHIEYYESALRRGIKYGKKIHPAILHGPITTNLADELEDVRKTLKRKTEKFSDADFDKIRIIKELRDNREYQKLLEDHEKAVREGLDSYECKTREAIRMFLSDYYNKNGIRVRSAPVGAYCLDRDVAGEYMMYNGMVGGAPFKWMKKGLLMTQIPTKVRGFPGITWHTKDERE